MKSYYPGKKFPSISITGTRCKLRCRHCYGHYLKSMIPAENPEALLSLSHKLKEEGANGFLLSGGFDEAGKLPISRFVPIIPEIEALGLEINCHVGLVDDELASRLRVLDVASIEIVGSQKVINEMYNLRASPSDYIRSAQKLEKNGVRVVPHICAGLNYGLPSRETKALKMIGEGLKPEVLVITSLVPTPGTAVEGVKYEYDSVLRVIKKAVELFPDVEIALGCMRLRSRGKEEFEERAIEMGVSRIAVPSKERGAKIEKCCAI